MENKSEIKPASGQLSTELSKDDLLKYVELDLWNRFQERLWKLVGLVLTIVTVLGLLGVPYYIRNEVTAHLQEREKEFADNMNEVLAYSKLLAVLKARYDSERYRLDGDVLRIVTALEQNAQADSSAKIGFLDPGSELISLISRQDFAEVTSGSPVAGHAFDIPEELKDKKLSPPTIFTVGDKGLTLATGGKEPHPVRNGTYRGSVKDFKYRITVLEALRRSIDKMQAVMLSLSTTFGASRKTEVVSVDTLQSQDFNQSFSSELALVANSFLTKEEQAEFARCQNLYTLGYKINYVPAAQQPQTNTGK